MLTNEDIAFLIKQTGWRLDYIRTVPLKELIALIEELSYQQKLRDYQLQVMFASIMATQLNCKATDLVGQPPLRKGIVDKESDIWHIAMKAGLRIPKDRS